MQRLLRENWLTIFVLALVMAGYVFLRTPGDEVGSTATFDEQVSSGRPTLVEFYSNT